MKMKKLFAMIMALTMLLFSSTQIFAKNEMVVSTSSNPDTLAQEVDKYVEDHLEELFECRFSNNLLRKNSSYML